MLTTQFRMHVPNGVWMKLASASEAAMKLKLRNLFFFNFRTSKDDIV